MGDIVTATAFDEETAIVVQGLINQLEEFSKKHGNLKEDQHFELIAKKNTRIAMEGRISGDEVVSFLNNFLSEHNDKLTPGQHERLDFIRDNAYKDFIFWDNELDDEAIEKVYKFIHGGGLQTLLHKHTGVVRVSPRVRRRGGDYDKGKPALYFLVGKRVSVID